VFDISYIKIRVVNDGKAGWECGWHGKMFAPRHASRALQLKKTSCKATIPDRFHMRYLALFNANVGQLASKKHSSKSIEEYVALQQDSSVENLLKNHVVMVSAPAIPSSSVGPFSFATAGASTSSLTSVKGSREPPFALSSQRSVASTMNMDVWKSNNSTVEMEIVNFFHCENIPDSVVDLPKFKQLVHLCHLVGEDFCSVPSKVDWRQAT
jgi:hypothetical protein